MAAKGIRAAARALDAVAEIVLAIVVLVVLGDRRRFAADLTLVWLAIAAYEGLTTQWFGASPGKLLLGLRTVELDRRGHPSATAAWRRAAVNGVLSLVLPVGGVFSLAILAVAGDPEVEGAPSAEAGVLLLLGTLATFGAWLFSMLGDPLGRGFSDRAGGTIVVPERFGAFVAVRDLPGFADAVRTPRMTRLGRVADADVRLRSRMRRLDDAPVLAGAIGLLALIVSVPIVGDDPDAVRAAVLLSSAAWIVLFVAHETALIARTGRTPGHVLAGTLITRRDRLGPPSTGRSLARAVVLGLTMYVPLLWPVLFVSLLMMRYGASGRGLHDVAGGTMVIADPALSPEMQRQRAMRMRMGRSG